MLAQTTSIKKCPRSFFDKYSFCHDIEEFNSYLYDPKEFVYQFHESIKNKQLSKLRNLRILIQNQTVSICRSGKYLYAPIDSQDNVQPKIVNLDLTTLAKAATESRYYKNEFTGFTYQRRENTEPKVMVFNGDCLDIAFHVQQELEGSFERVAVLNMANPNTPGGKLWQ